MGKPLGKPVQFYLDEKLREELVGLTRETGRTLSDEIRRAIERHLAARPRVVEPPLQPEEVVRAARKGPEEAAAEPPKRRSSRKGG
jgi:hypothetical protein